jgi:hypothetical protein
VVFESSLSLKSFSTASSDDDCDRDAPVPPDASVSLRSRRKVGRACGILPAPLERFMILWCAVVDEVGGVRYVIVIAVTRARARVLHLRGVSGAWLWRELNGGYSRDKRGWRVGNRVQVGSDKRKHEK